MAKNFWMISKNKFKLKSLNQLIISKINDNMINLFFTIIKLKHYIYMILIFIIYNLDYIMTKVDIQKTLYDFSEISCQLKDPI